MEELKGFDLFANCSDSHEHQVHSSTLFVPLKHFFDDLFGDILFQQVQYTPNVLSIFDWKYSVLHFAR